MKRILIANRGEIAHRIIKTVNRLGHTSVALKLPSDKSPYYLKEAAEVISYEKDDPRLSFLDEVATVKLAKNNNIDLIHPGYGFLSESGSFAKKVTSAGMIFIGPSSDTLYKLGDKILAKNIALACDVPTISGFKLPAGPIVKSTLASAIKGLGFPLIIKAGAGGGGRGMRIADSISSLHELIPGARLEAKRNFGNDELFIETFLQEVKHIEVQVIGDSSGALIHLFERDCSLQRKFQKVIEIAPAVDINNEILQELYQSSFKIGKKSKLTNASTFEFLIDTKKNKHYFIEANPRLQVEHTITEEITGLDIVELQINSALGKKLPTQKNIKKKGVSVQVRVCSEIPELNFAPSVGKLESWDTNTKLNSVRMDLAYEPGETIGCNFDSLLGKIIVTKDSLQECWEELIFKVLPTSVPIGIRTNIPFLISLINHLKTNTSIHTKWIENSFLGNYLKYYNSMEEKIKTNVSSLYKLIKSKPKTNGTDLFQNGLLRQDIYDQYELSLNIALLEQNLSPSDNRPIDLKLIEDKNNTYIQIDDQSRFYILTSLKDENIAGFFNGIPFEISIKKASNTKLTENELEAGSNIVAPLPGTVIAINCEPGDKVTAGIPVLSIESMKTEHKLVPRRDSVIQKINVKIGDQVVKGQNLIQCKPGTNNISE